MSKRGLGRGLGALIPEVEVGDRERESIREIELTRIVANPKQPRKHFDRERLEELAASIREHGVVQPVVVRPRDGQYELVAGERRWRACQIAGVAKVPALVREFSEAEVMEIALIENLQREGLNPLEEAEAYRTLLEEFQLTQDDLARRLGRSRPQITNTLRLLNLGEMAQEELRAGRLSMGHAKVLLSVEGAESQEEFARRVVREDLSVRELERVLAEKRPGRKARSSGRAKLGPELADVEERLRELFGTPVRLVDGGEKGRIEITFFGDEGLGRILEVLGLGEATKEPARRPNFRV